MGSGYVVGDMVDVKDQDGVVRPLLNYKQPVGRGDVEMQACLLHDGVGCEWITRRAFLQHDGNPCRRSSLEQVDDDLTRLGCHLESNAIAHTSGSFVASGSMLNCGTACDRW